MNRILVTGWRRAKPMSQATDRFVNAIVRVSAMAVCNRAQPRTSVTRNIVVFLLILLLLFGGGGLYMGGPLVGGSLGGLILLVLIIMLLTGRVGSRA